VFAPFQSYKVLRVKGTYVLNRAGLVLQAPGRVLRSEEETNEEEGYLKLRNDIL